MLRFCRHYVKYAIPEAKATDQTIGQNNRKLLYPRQTYEPYELNNANTAAWFKRKLKAEKTDIINTLKIDPISSYKDPSILSHFVTRMGMIKSHKETGLTKENQKRISQAVKRARCAGILPYTYRLPFGYQRVSVFEDNLKRRL